MRDGLRGPLGTRLNQIIPANVPSKATLRECLRIVRLALDRDRAIDFEQIADTIKQTVGGERLLHEVVCSGRS